MSKSTAQEIQKVALQLFSVSDYAKVTIHDICEAAGITKSTFYYHFPSKEAILTNFYKYTPVLPPETLHKLATSENCWEKLWACLEPMVDWTISAGAAILAQVFIFNIQSRTNAFTIDNEQEYQKLFIGIIKKGQDSGRFYNRSTPESIYANITNIILGIAVQWCIQNGDFDEKQAIFDSVKALLSVKGEFGAFESAGNQTSTKQK